MAITIDRTNYNALVDDDGTNTKGTPWSKNQVKIVLMDPIDGALAKVLDPLSLGVHEFTASGSVTNVLKIRNTGSTPSSHASLAVGNDAQTDLLSIVGYGSATSASGAGWDVPNGVVVFTLGSQLSFVTYQSTAPMKFFTGGIERMRIDQNGTLTVMAAGNHTLAAPGNNVFSIRNTAPGSGNYCSIYVGNDASATTTILQSYSSNFTTSGFGYANGSLLYSSGSGGLSIACIDTSAAIRFYVNSGERMRVAATGEILINTLANPAAGRVVCVVDGNTQQAFVAQSITGNICYFFYCLNTGNAGIGGISQSGAGSVVFNTTSDARLKIDQGRATNLEALRAVVVHDFRWKADDRWDRGVFAQETEPLFPRAVSKGTDDLTEGGDLKSPWMTDYSKFVPDLIVGWQHHDAEIAQLRATLAALMKG